MSTVASKFDVSHLLWCPAELQRCANPLVDCTWQRSKSEQCERTAKRTTPKMRTCGPDCAFARRHARPACAQAQQRHCAPVAEAKRDIIDAPLNFRAHRRRPISQGQAHAVDSCQRETQCARLRACDSSPFCHLPCSRSTRMWSTCVTASTVGMLLGGLLSGSSAAKMPCIAVPSAIDQCTLVHLSKHRVR